MFLSCRIFQHAHQNMLSAQEVTVSETEQGRQCRYNVMLKPYVQPLLQYKDSKHYTTWVCICSLRNSACNVHAPYCHLWPAPLYKIFLHYLANGKIFKKKNIEHYVCVLIFSTTFIENILILRRTELDMIKNVYGSLCKVYVILVKF